MVGFELDARLQNDCTEVGEFSLCKVLLTKDANYPWLILVPKRNGISEIYQLSVEDQEQLCWESSFTAKQLAKFFQADKMNVAALGNVVSQLHVHHIVRKKDDACWPNPVWGAVPALAYSSEGLAFRVTQLQEVLATSVFTKTIA